MRCPGVYAGVLRESPLTWWNDRGRATASGEPADVTAAMTTMSPTNPPRARTIVRPRGRRGNRLAPSCVPDWANGCLSHRYRAGPEAGACGSVGIGSPAIEVRTVCVPTPQRSRCSGSRSRSGYRSRALRPRRLFGLCKPAKSAAGATRCLRPWPLRRLAGFDSAIGERSRSGGSVLTYTKYHGTRPGSSPLRPYSPFPYS